MAEHQAILALLDAVDAEVGRLMAGGRLRPAFWRRVAEFTEEFIDGCHHGKEEQLLFPCLIQCGIPASGGPLSVMEREHVAGREMMQAIVRASVRGDGALLCEVARRYVRFKRDHIEKEDNVLFEIARQALSAEQAARLRERFAQFDARVPPAILTARLARELCEEVGVVFDRPRGRAWVGGFKR